MYLSLFPKNKHSLNLTINSQCCPHIETRANQLTGFYMRATLALNGLSRIAAMSLTISARFLSKFEQVFARKEKSYVKFSNLCK